MVNSGLQCQEDQGIDFRSVDQLTESERPYPRQRWFLKWLAHDQCATDSVSPVPVSVRTDAVSFSSECS